MLTITYFVSLAQNNYHYHNMNIQKSKYNNPKIGISAYKKEITPI